MNLDYELIIFLGVIITGICALIAKIYTKKSTASPQWIKAFHYLGDFFIVFLIVFLFRSFFYENFKIPSGSLKPTLLVGDVILVNKFAYGIRIPLTHTKIIDIGTPKRGDIFVFRSPKEPKDLIKRVIGLPGDRIDYVNRILYINGKKIPQEYLNSTQDWVEPLEKWDVKEYEEDLLGTKHKIYLIPGRDSEDFHNIIVPKDRYFAMGDNRDDSDDSRFWGFVPPNNIIGKPSIIWMSWDSEADILHKIRWDRIGKSINS